MYFHSTRDRRERSRMMYSYVVTRTLKCMGTTSCVNLRARSSFVPV